MAINSRQKGARFERSLAHRLNDYGFECRRGQQYCGATGEADDVVGLKGIHIEAKSVERLNIYDAIAQARRDANEDEFPTVFHKKNNKEILVTMPLEYWIELYKGWLREAEQSG